MSRNGLRVSAAAAPVREQVLRNIRAAILDRTFVPGQRLIERELCELTGVSRTSVREALRQLESEGLIVPVPNRGPVVAEMTAPQAADVYEVRAVLEALAARLFTIYATDAEIARLSTVIDAVERAARDDDLVVLLAAKDDFYSVLWVGARNTVMRSMLDGLRARMTFVRATSLSRPERSTETVRELRALLAAIARRDPDAAHELCLRHIDNAARAALATLTEA